MELPESPQNRAALEAQLNPLKRAMRTEMFDHRPFFQEMVAPDVVAPPLHSDNDRSLDIPSFTLNSADLWISEFYVGGRKTRTTTVRGIPDKYLVQKFGATNIGRVPRAQVSEFRNELSTRMTPLRRQGAASGAGAMTTAGWPVTVCTLETSYYRCTERCQSPWPDP